MKPVETIHEQLLIDGFPAFPIYKFSFRWTQDGVQDPNYPKWHEGLPPGRIFNGTGFSKMFMEEKTQEEIDKIASDWWEKYIAEEKNAALHPELVKMKASFFEHETWYITWFQHETFDTGQSDQEVLQSFEKFVTRKEMLNERQRMNDDTDAYCLMGAEDRWRWHGAEPGGDGGDRSPAPCRCKHCKEQGVVRIAH